MTIFLTRGHALHRLASIRKLFVLSGSLEISGSSLNQVQKKNKSFARTHIVNQNKLLLLKNKDGA